MSTAIERRTVDLSQYPNLVVIYLGMRVNRLTGLKTLFGFGPRIANSVAARPDGLLLHENSLFSFFPVHAGMRQYWRDMESLLAWSRLEPHRDWWKNFLRNSGSTGFWHETYMMQGGMEAIYDGRSDRFHALCTDQDRAWPDVWRCSSCRQTIRCRASGQRKRIVRTIVILNLL
jgi:hypothetical protein